MTRSRRVPGVVRTLVRATAATARYDYILARAQLEAVLGRGL